jgi:hypothetical protein
LLSTGAKRRREWKEIQKILALKMPLLAFSQGVETSLSLAFVGMATMIALLVLPKTFPSMRIENRIGSFCFTFFGSSLLWAITRVTLQPLATELPMVTVGELTKAIVARNYGKVVLRAGGWNEKELWEALRDFIADEISIKRERITRETLFADGLGIY